MFKGEIELEAELEDLMSILAESELEFEIEAELTPAKRTRGREVADDQIRAGVTDENRVTDAVFYDLNPAWKDKKLPASAAKALRDEWTEIRNRIVRPRVKEISCSGWERDLQSFAKRAAEHHLKGSATVTRIVQTANPPNWACDVLVNTGDGSTTLTVQLSPAEKLVRVAPASGGPMMCYQYRCVAANVVFQDAACPGPASEFEAELEDLMSTLSASNLESEAEMFATPASGPAPVCNDKGLPTPSPGFKSVSGARIQCPGRGDAQRILGTVIGNAVQMLDNTIAELTRARQASCQGKPLGYPNLSDVTACWLRYKLGVCIDDLSAWTAGTFDPKSVAEVIRRLVRPRDLLASNEIVYVCEQTCNPGVNARTIPMEHGPNNTVRCIQGSPDRIIHLCPRFWEDAHAPFREQTIIHETVHLTHCGDEDAGIGVSIGSPECLAQFVVATNGKGLDPDFVGRCGFTNRCGAIPPDAVHRHCGAIVGTAGVLPDWGPTR